MLAFLVASMLFAGSAPVTDGPPLEVEGLGGAPTETAADQLLAGVISERWWTRDAGAFVERLAEIRLRRPVAPRPWLEGWRARTGCTATVTRRVAPIAWLKAPQLTFGGICKGGDAYVIHLVQVRHVMVELHVDTTRLEETTRLVSRLEAAMRALLSRARRPDSDDPEGR